MRNWWPQPYGCAARNGFSQWASELTGGVHSLASLSNMDGSDSFYAWAADDFYDISLSGPATAPVLTGLTVAPWQSVQLVNAAGAHLIAVNGADEPIHVVGGVASRFTAATWLGITPEDAVQVTVHQSRLWAVEKNTANGWYLPPDAVSGTFVKFDFGPLFPRGGFLLYLTTWTIDDGNGAEDHLVGLSSQGDAVVFAGTDPDDDTKWALVGVYYMGAPVSGRRSYAKVGGDLLILTQQGAASMAETLISTKVENSTIKLRTDKIQLLISELANAYSLLPGWELRYFAENNMLLINVPSIVGGANIQLASNQLTNAWTQFVGMDAAAWISHANRMFFADYLGNVWRAWDGSNDGVLYDGTGGQGVEAACQQAYSYFGSPAAQKQVGLYRPNFMVTIPVAFNSSIVYDFASPDFTPANAPPGLTGSLWGAGLWGAALWSGGSSVQRNWIQAAGMGSAVSLQLSLRSTGEVLWVGTDYSLINGWGIL